VSRWCRCGAGFECGDLPDMRRLRAFSGIDAVSKTPIGGVKVPAGYDQFVRTIIKALSAILARSSGAPYFEGLPGSLIMRNVCARDSFRIEECAHSVSDPCAVSAGPCIRHASDAMSLSPVSNGRICANSI
jgi:hypothetical protein